MATLGNVLVLGLPPLIVLGLIWSAVGAVIAATPVARSRWRRALLVLLLPVLMVAAIIGIGMQGLAY